MECLSEYTSDTFPSIQEIHNEYVTNSNSIRPFDTSSMKSV